MTDDRFDAGYAAARRFYANREAHIITDYRKLKARLDLVADDLLTKSSRADSVDVATSLYLAAALIRDELNEVDDR